MDKTVHKKISFWNKILSSIAKIGVNPGDSEEVCLQKYISVVTAIAMSVVATIWGIIYLLLGEMVGGIVPISYAIITFILLVSLKYNNNNFKIFHFIHILITLLLPFIVMIALGGFINGSVAIIWGFFASIVALLTLPFKNAMYWFIAYVLLVIFSGIIDPYLDRGTNLSGGVILLFFMVNIICIAITNFLILSHFVKQKNIVLNLLQKTEN